MTETAPMPYKQLQKMAIGELESLLDSLARGQRGSFRKNVRYLAKTLQPRKVRKRFRYAVLIQRLIDRKEKTLATRRAKADARVDPADAGVVLGEKQVHFQV
ncbi:MAG TPA: hypothetical protein VD967_02075 [Candidatus Paceibacterota bacterium]|nr:hypothetical protein [Candidatus Paceibacterota bacterium]